MWPLTPPTLLELWLADHFSHGHGHVLSAEAMAIARRLEDLVAGTYSGIEGSLALREFENLLMAGFADRGHSITPGEWLVILRALKNALSITGHPWIPNDVTSLGLALSHDFPRGPSPDPTALIQHRPRGIDETALLEAISHLVLCAYAGALRRRVEKGQVLHLPSFAKYVSGEVRESQLIVSGEALEADLILAEERMENPTPSSLRFAEDNELDVVPLWFDSPASVFGDDQLFADPQEFNPWWLGFMSFPRSFPPGLLTGDSKQVARVRAMLHASAHLARTDIGVWCPRFGVLSATHDQLRRSRLTKGDVVPSSSVFQWKRGYLIDLGGLTTQLTNLYTPPQGGPKANVAARRFEAHVQEVIDATTWCPKGDFRNLIGKQIRDDQGLSITDIDAVAVRGKQLLLVDCKDHSPIGDTYREVRNRRSSYEADAAEWKDKCRRIDQTRNVLGVPSGYQIDGIVVVPRPGFIDAGVATETVAGQPRVTGIYEMYQHFRDWNEDDQQ
jgi:hypothetical protein